MQSLGRQPLVALGCSVKPDGHFVEFLRVSSGDRQSGLPIPELSIGRPGGRGDHSGWILPSIHIDNWQKDEFRQCFDLCWQDPQQDDR